MNFSSFLQQHMILCTAFVFVLIMYLHHEWTLWTSKIKAISPQEVIQLMNQQQALVLDVRDAKIFAEGHITNAERIDEAKLSKPLQARYLQQPVIIVCQDGQKAFPLAQALLKQKPEGLFLLRGGMQSWLAEGLPVVSGK
jgi:rhodanese-related sulfurtransferase